MIARHWRGWTKRENADAYERLLNTKVLPGLRALTGYRGGYVLRNDGERDSEFMVINFFESLEAVKKFAGPQYTVAVFEPEAKALLARFEPVATHYEVRMHSSGAGA
jgi:heme-degrading monooxygenase HmoA